MNGKIDTITYDGHSEAGVIFEATNMTRKKWDIIEKSFNAYWKNGQKQKAIDLYVKNGRPFWYAEVIGRYYERKGLMSKAVKEYEHLVHQYFEMDILPLPRGPVELFKLGKWYSNRCPSKAKKYLTLYLRAEKEDSGTGFGIRHKTQAQKVLMTLSAAQGKG